MSDIVYKIICHGDGRVLASLDLNGTLTIHHDHFNSDEGFEIEKIIKALDKWEHRRDVRHLSTRGSINLDVVEQVNQIQKARPGKIWFPEYEQSWPAKPD